MPRYVTVPIDPEIAVGTSNGDPAEIDDPVIVGDPAGCLSDDSDATYAEVPATDEVFSSSVTGTLLRPRRVTRDASAGPIKARIRIKGPASSRVTVQSSLLGEDFFTANTPGAPPATPTWVEFDLVEDDRSTQSNPMRLLIDYLNGEPANYTMSMTVHTSGGPPNARLYVYEAQLLVPGGPVGDHPLRHYPRDDQLAGHVRRYPSTSFQGTRRRAGGYR